MVISRGGIVVLALLVGQAATARAGDDSDPVAAKARTLIDDLMYDEARELLQSDLEEGDNQPDSVAAAHMLLGEIFASLGEESEARLHFRYALSLDTSLALPDGSSPKIAEPFSAARAALEGTDPMGATLQRNGDKVVVVVESDPSNLVMGARVRFVRADGEQDEVSGRGRDRVSLNVPEDARDLEVVVVDEHGNVVAIVGGGGSSGGDEDDEEEEEELSLSTSTSDAGPSLMTRWELWGGLALGFAAFGTWAGLDARKRVREINDLEDGTEFSVALAMEKTAKRRALYADIGFAAAGACAVAAAVFYWRGRKAPSDDELDESEALLTPVAGPSSVGVQAHFRF